MEKRKTIYKLIILADVAILIAIIAGIYALVKSLEGSKTACGWCLYDVFMNYEEGQVESYEYKELPLLFREEIEEGESARTFEIIIWLTNENGDLQKDYYIGGVVFRRSFYYKFVSVLSWVSDDGGANPLIRPTEWVIIDMDLYKSEIYED